MLNNTNVHLANSSITNEKKKNENKKDSLM